VAFEADVIIFFLIQVLVPLLFPPRALVNADNKTLFSFLLMKNVLCTSLKKHHPTGMKIAPTPKAILVNKHYCS
jgi:hypothetical protein